VLLSSGWQPLCLAQFLVNPDSSIEALWQCFLPLESPNIKAGETWVKKWLLNFAYKASLKLAGFFHMP
jgi:hypothetical protein